MKQISILLLLLTLAGAASAQNYIGYKHKGVVYGKTLPNGIKDLGGGLLSDADYGITRFSKGKTFMLWLEKIVARDEKGVPDWEVKDVLAFNKLKKNQEFLFSYSSPCTLNGEENLEMIVMTEFQPKKKNYKILKAWQVSLDDERFEKLSTKKIKCEYSEP
ncbi:MAG TPA: hypothetical protein VGC76_16250 [Pyrinomonadaceae bacterium]|jgi:hypothetical protein